MTKLIIPKIETITIESKNHGLVTGNGWGDCLVAEKSVRISVTWLQGGISNSMAKNETAANPAPAMAPRMTDPTPFKYSVIKAPLDHHSLTCGQSCSHPPFEWLRRGDNATWRINPNFLGKSTQSFLKISGAHLRNPRSKYITALNFQNKKQ